MVYSGRLRRKASKFEASILSIEVSSSQTTFQYFHISVHMEIRRWTCQVNASNNTMNTKHLEAGNSFDQLYKMLIPESDRFELY